MRCASAAQIREMEQTAVADGVPEYELMRRAGSQAAQWIKASFPDAGRFVVLCGGGNNGGDALVAAAHLAPFETVVYSTREVQCFSGCAACAMRDLPPGIPFFVRSKLDRFDFRPGDVIVDGLLGIGFAGNFLREDVCSYIAAANSSHLPVVALDLPSGLHGDSGNIAENGVLQADMTLVFGALKPGLFTANAAGYCGTVRLIPIGLNEHLAAGDEVFCNCDAAEKIFRFAADCHKNSRGRVLVWGSSPEYRGAAALSTLAAMKAGAGMVRCASEADLSGRLPNAAIFRQLKRAEIPHDFMDSSDVLVCGCGWGTCGSAGNLAAACSFPGKLILDADALNCLAADTGIWHIRKDVVITPHPGEAARLLNGFGIAYSGDRRKAALDLAGCTGAVTVLKGKNTIVAAPDGRAVTVAAGNALLATAGSGDVLAGVIGAFAAQGMDIFDAAALGAYIHGAAGEYARKVIIADELPEIISSLIIRIQHGEFI